MDYTVDDFTTGLAPFEYVYSFKSNPFQHERMQKKMADYAKSIGFIGFAKQYKAYLKTMSNAGKLELDNPTAFTGQPIELNAGGWIADDTGVYRETPYGTEFACMHPIMPVERLVNVDTGEEKMKLSFRKGSVWRSIVADKTVLASANKITQLASTGILVTSENAKPLIRYLSEVDAKNYDIMPERKSVGRLGYIHGEGFSPYVDGLQFDGDKEYRPLFDMVHTHGTFEGWRETAMKGRAMSVTAKVLLAASFASPLLEPLNALPFFVHMWCGNSGTGKTVALCLAASVWADPPLGKYVKTFDSTKVGHERVAAFLNHLPLCLDELQLAKDTHGRTNFDVYALAQGVGRTRGNRQGGIDMTPTWRCAILTTGESPLTGQSAGAGAVNRVVDIECRPDEPVIVDGRKYVRELSKNYGFAGKEFVRRLYNGDGEIERAIALFDRFFDELSQQDTTEKQAMAAAAILTGDTLACDWIFEGRCQPLTVTEISEFLATKSSVNLGARAYDWLVDWVFSNQNRFDTTSANAGAVFGAIDDNLAYIIPSVFDSALIDEGYSPRSVKSYLKANCLIITDGGGKSRFTKRSRIMGRPTSFICLKLPADNVSCDDIEPL